MGNHEYCEECGENSFHSGEPCDPKKAAKVRIDKMNREISIKLAEKKMIKMILPILKKHNIEYEVKYNCIGIQEIVISPYQFEK